MSGSVCMFRLWCFYDTVLQQKKGELKKHALLLLCRSMNFTGALVLYSSEKNVSPREDSHSSASKSRKKRQGSGKSDPENVARVLERLGNVRRFMASVLYLDDREVCFIGSCSGWFGVFVCLLDVISWHEQPLYMQILQVKDYTSHLDTGIYLQ